MSAPSPPPDNSAQVAQIEADAAAKKREEDRIAAEKKAQQLAELRASSRQGATGSVNDYFSSQGVDPTEYSGQISSKLNAILAGIGPEDPNPSSAFTDAGASIFGELETGNRNKQLKSLDSIFAPNWEMERVPWTLDDPYLAAIEATQRQSSEDILRNMLDRGVITNTGFQAGIGDLDKQRPSVNARLTGIGTGVLSDEQNSLRGVSNKARETASSLRLGQFYDPFAYQTEADNNFGEFIRNLSDTLNAKVGPSNLYSTAGLAGIAGAAQGAGNTAFDPTAAAGIIDLNDPNAKKNQNATTPTTSESIF